MSKNIDKPSQLIKQLGRKPQMARNMNICSTKMMIMGDFTCTSHKKHDCTEAC